MKNQTENPYALLFSSIDRRKEEILEAEHEIWTHPETGFREWNTHQYMKTRFKKLGYKIREAGNIPGFYADFETGRPGPKVGVFAEMDALLIPEHPAADKETGAVHACAHHCQCAAMLGLAAALREPGAADSVCGSVRLFVVPAEELIELGYRKELIRQGILHFCGGKQEFLYRGYLDGVDIALQLHTGTHGIFCNNGCNGSISKRFTFIGRASHGASPARGINALYAATGAVGAVNALREVLCADEYFRFCPIITKGGDSTNVIPSEVTVEGFLRGSSVRSLTEANRKINRAFAASAAAIGCRLRVEDSLGYLPRKDDKNLQKAILEVGSRLFSPEEVRLTDVWEAGCTDMGDLSSLIPTAIGYIGCSAVPGHTADFVVEDPITACVTNAKLLCGIIQRLLENNAAYAKKAIAEAEILYPNREAYLRAAEALSSCGETVLYRDDGTILLS